jgi:hypothetical protein
MMEGEAEVRTGVVGVVGEQMMRCFLVLITKGCPVVFEVLHMYHKIFYQDLSHYHKMYIMAYYIFDAMETDKFFYM